MDQERYDFKQAVVQQRLARQILTVRFRRTKLGNRFSPQAIRLTEAPACSVRAVNMKILPG